jgi:hypothetical protein
MSTDQGTYGKAKVKVTVTLLKLIHRVSKNVNKNHKKPNLIKGGSVFVD